MHALKKTLIWGVAVILMTGGVTVWGETVDSPGHEKASLDLRRGQFTILRYPAKLKGEMTAPKSVIVFGSGCGGWNDWERSVARELQAKGNEVLGIDYAHYAKADYDLATLEADYQTIINYGLSLWPNQSLPVILGGWSTGAEQAVAVVGGPSPPSGVVGLLLISPGSEGGYGPYATNYLMCLAPRTKYFKLSDFASKMEGLRIAQWHAEYDVVDSMAWLRLLKTVHREYDFPNVIHDYAGACRGFLIGLNHSVSWILGEDRKIPQALGITVFEPREVSTAQR